MGAHIGTRRRQCSPKSAKAEQGARAHKSVTPMTDAEALIEAPFATPDKRMPDSPLHQKLSSRSRKSVEDMMEDSKRRQSAADALLASQRSARQQKLQSERAHEQEVKHRLESGITEIEQSTARKEEWRACTAVGPTCPGQARAAACTGRL